ncbi:16S rRNA (cytosine(1402)-N(4))-methyltransferase RsmH [Acidipropionibacterium timonense]|uniref:16S rRNA (cytosine(1402)-N(4))-methyltransferase RsmH n=1 Tax=Acidipropionibacterium timonense TaxID=2161818 RepID=UPI00102F6824|nr:16S rRNA (cytosine(1402)-N(4))-methyltransferase RsmH [Acidipropionibacterium timonense]
MEQHEGVIANPAAGDALHVPVMRDRIVELLSTSLHRRPDDPHEPHRVHVDGTLGMGGHAEAVLDACPRVHLVGIDRDPEALALAKARLSRFADRIDLVHAVHDDLPRVLDDLGIDRVDSILLDLGLSSLQIDHAERGFAYSVDAPLDMRMDQTEGPTAADLVNGAEPAELVRILRQWGEERFADRIVRAIVRRRQTAPLRTSGELVEVISSAVPAAARHRGGHPAKRTFQGLRIAVNHEMDTLPRVLPEALDRLAVGGRMAVLAYHSLEDRPVKEAFRAACSDSAPPGLPVVPESMSARFVAVTHGAERPGPDELSTNPRSASARLRVIERVKEPA